MREIVISKNEAGQRLNKLVMKYLNKAPSSFVYRMIRKKNIKLNGGKAVGNEIVYVGDVIQLYLADDTIDSFRDDNIQTAASGSQKKFKPEIIYHDHNVLIVNKPVGVLSQKASKDDYSINESVLDYLLDNGYITSEQLRTYKPSICNRLDRNTSGLVLCGVSLMGNQELSRIIRERNIDKYYYTIVKGQTLFETLLFSMIPLDQIDIPFDSPPVFWRNQALVTPKKKIAETSWLYGMLFPARRVTLVPGDKEVAEVYLSAGLDYTAMESWKDPFVTYRYIKDVRAPWRPNQGKAVWRNLNDLVDVKGKRAPAVLRQYFDLEKDSEDASIALYGVQTNQASFLGTFQYDLKIPARLTRDDSALRFLTLVIRAAENMEKAVHESLADVPGISSALISSASRIFYDRCESKFWAVCANLGNSVEALKAQYLAWCDDLTGIANSVRIRILREAQLSGHSLAKAAAHEKDILFATGKNKKGME